MERPKKLIFLASSFLVLNCFADDAGSILSSHSSNKDKSGEKEQPIFVDSDAGKVWNIFGLKIVGKNNE